MPYAKIDDIRLFFDVYGSKLFLLEDHIIEKPTLIVLHGTPGLVDHSLYVSFWSKFADIAQVIFLDQRGAGRSEAGHPKTWSIAQQGKDIHAFCQTLGIEKPIVAGVSWGGYVTMSYGAQFPGHAEGLIFCNSEAVVSPEARRDAFLKIGGEKAAQASWECDTNWSEETFSEYLKCCMPLYAKNAYSQGEMSRCIQNQEVFYRLCREEYRQFDLRDSLASIQSPVLHLAGEDDPAHPPVCAEESMHYLPKGIGELALIKGAADPVYRDQPEITEQLIRKFIQKLER